VAFALALGTNWFALVPWRRSVGKHWTERARLLYPARAFAGTRVWLLYICFVLLNYIVDPDVDLWLVAVCGAFGVWPAAYFVTRELFPSLQFGSWLRTRCFLAAVSGRWLIPLLVFVIFWIPEDFGWMTWLIAGGFTGLLLATLFGWPIYPLKWCGILLEGSYRLNRLVDDVSQRMQVRVSAVLILPSYLCNAWAVLYTRQVIFSDQLLAVLSNEQIMAICAHELAHLNDRHKGLPVRIATACALSSAVFIRPLLALEGNAEQIALRMMAYGVFLLVSGALAIWAGRRIARGMEERADRAAVTHQRDVEVYAGALARVYEANQMPAVMSRRTGLVHPDLYDRMLAAGITPDFPKPLPPQRRPAGGVLVGLLFTLTVGLVAIAVGVFLEDQ